MKQRNLEKQIEFSRDFQIIVTLHGQYHILLDISGNGFKMIFIERALKSVI